MQPKIEKLNQSTFIGKRTKMSLTNNTTRKLWQSFMPERKIIPNTIGSEYYSIEVYSPDYFKNFSPDKPFEKWAAVETTNADIIPEGMETITLPEGLYVVFIHKGPASDGPKTYQYIFQTWLPNSKYALDNRPHFAKMGEKYKSEDPDSEEEIWIPIKPK